MKIAVIGGGSTYTPELADGLSTRAGQLDLRELALVDSDPERLNVVGSFVQRMVAASGASVAVTLTENLATALAGADFVITQIRVGGQQSRLRDEKRGISRGILGQETTGVGGFSKAMRTIPAILDIVHAIERYAPEATLINFTNPVSIVTQALLTQSRVRTIGLCNIPISLRMDLASTLGIDAQKIRLDSVGLNHLSFVRQVFYDGENILPSVLKRVGLEQTGKPANIPELEYPHGFVEALGMIPSDYLRYFFLQRETVAEQQTKGKTRAEEVMEIERELLQLYADPRNATKPASLEKRGGAFYSLAAIEIIEAMASNAGAELVVDVLNQGAVPDLDDRGVVEVPCRIDHHGAHPLPQEPLPPFIKGLIVHVKCYEDLTVEAALSKSKAKALLALTSHPLMPSVELATEIIEELAPELGLH